MVVRFSSKGWKFSERVCRAFYDYGRLSAAHPMGCLSISIITILVLSYPAISKLGLPISNPMDIYWTSLVDNELNSTSSPEWLANNRNPSFYIQQIILKGSVEPWFGNLSARDAVRASLSESFHILKILNETKSQDGVGLDDLCFSGTLENRVLRGILPQKSCILLSPSLFWHNNLELFEKDQNILNTIFKYYCSPSMCTRDILFGTPTRLTGIKQNYQTNRHRSIDYAITLIQNEFNPKWREALITQLENKYKPIKSHALDDETLIHVFYRPRKYFSDYIPLLASYFLCALYFYYTIKKFQMSKWGLALAAFITVMTTLSSTAGICSYFELNASLWRSSVLPYLAMILSLENIMCITRSTIYTPPSLDVHSRLANGLSFEGFSITKYFLLELLFLSIGYITGVPQIQEFALFAFIGIVVDLYMQLFFYVPCLAFDLYRLDREDKQRFSLMLFDTDIRQLKSYPNPRCPARHFVPSLFARKNRLVRTHSETGISKNDGSTTVTYKGHRRSASSDKNVILKSGSLVSNRLRLLYFWTKTRIAQRLIMAFFCVWVMWLAFIVHKWRVFEGLFGALSNGTANRDSVWISHYFLDTAPLEFGDWQRQTFKWWPALFAEYNFSLSAQYITFLPPIFLQATISAFDPILAPKKKDSQSSYSNDFVEFIEESGPELKNRVFWLERQMLVFSVLIPFTIVVIFTLYTCFWDKLSSYREARRSAAILKADKKRALTNKKGFVELVSSAVIIKLFIFKAPLAFSRHESPLECASIDPPNTIVSASVNGRVFIWDSRSGELRNSIQRTPNRPLTQTSTQQSTNPRPLTSNSTLQQRKRADSNAFVPNEPSPATISSLSIQDQPLSNMKTSKSLVWCLAVRNNIIALGCSNGIIQLANSKSARLIGTFDESLSTSGIVHIELRGNRIIFVRLNGVLEIVEFRLTEGTLEDQKAEFNRLSVSRLHKKPVTKLLCSTWQIITASYDQTLRIFDSRDMFISHTLNGHTATIISACVSEEERLLFSSCDAGRVCCWSLEDGQLLRSVDTTIKQFLELSCTRSILIGFGGGRLWLWDLKEGGTLAELSLNEQAQPLTLLLDVDDGIDQTLRGGLLAVLSDQHIVTSDAETVQIWDLQLRAIVKQVRLPGFVDSVQRLDEKSALCCSGTEMFCVSVPQR